MRRIKELPPVLIPAEDYRWLDDACRDLLAGARFTTASGVALYAAQAEAEPQVCYLRDFAQMVQYAGHLLPPGEILSAIDHFLAHQDDEGWPPESIDADDEVEHLASYGDEVLGEGPPLDNPAFLVKLLDAYYLLTGDAVGVGERLRRAFAAMEAVPLSPDGPVVVDANRPRPSYGYTDTAAKTGKVFFASLLYWEAAKRLARRLQELEDHEEARVWYEVENRVRASLDEFQIEEGDLYWAASEDCHQFDLWGTAYATVMRVASKTETRRLAQLYLDYRDNLIWKGHLRPLVAGEYWGRMLAPVPPETYQNGAYWALPAGWMAQMVATVDTAAAGDLVGEVLQTWREEGIYQCLSPYGPPKGENYVLSATNLLGAVKSR